MVKAAPLSGISSAHLTLQWLSLAMRVLPPVAMQPCGHLGDQVYCIGQGGGVGEWGG